MQLIQKLISACRSRQHIRTANQALRIATHLPEGSELKDYAQTLAAQELKRALREDARTHIGRLCR